QYAGSTSLTEPKGSNAFVFISSSGTSEPTILPMVHRISTANTNSDPSYTIFLEIGKYESPHEIKM
ncbi:MAG TPA: hypothetical protein VFS97_10815, partial [Nitrososphaeraceae archaeon]|nr:hypothetical protein [Nitrososphaeraceae archaeon]